MSKARRSNYWASIVYPESAPSDWFEKLSSFKIRAFVSPLHDLDKTADGDLKKPHFHVLLLYDSLKSQSQVDEVFKLIGGVGSERVSSLRGYARYLCHLDDPDKSQYDISCVQAIGDMDYNFIINSIVDKYATAKEMIEFCQSSSIFHFCDLVDYAVMNRPDWFMALHDSSTYLIKEYIKTRYFKSKGKSDD